MNIWNKLEVMLEVGSGTHKGEDLKQAIEYIQKDNKIVIKYVVI